MFNLTHREIRVLFKKLGPYTSVASTLITKTSPQPQSMLFFFFFIEFVPLKKILVRLNLTMRCDSLNTLLLESDLLGSDVSWLFQFCDQGKFLNLHVPQVY